MARPKSASWWRGHDPDLERRARGVRREGDARVVLPRRAARGGAPPRGRAGSTGTRPRGSRSARRRRAPRRPDAGSAAGRTGRGTGGWSGRRPGRPSSGRPGGTRSGRPRAASAIASRQRREHRRDQLVADRVERPVLARRRDDRPPAARRPGRARSRPGRGCVELARLLLGADDVEGVVLEDPQPDAVARPARGSSGSRRRRRPARPRRANRSRSKARSTTVATHQPVIASLRSSNRPATASRSRTPARRRAPAELGSASPQSAPAREAPRAPSERAPASPPRRRVGRGRLVAAGRARAAIEVETHAGHAARVDQLEVGQVRRSTFRAMPW